MPVEIAGNASTRACSRRRARARCDSGGEQCILACLRRATPARPHGSRARRKPVAARDLRLAGVAAAERAAFREKLRPGGAVDRAVDAATAEQRLFAALTIASTSSVVMSATHDIEIRCGRLRRRRRVRSCGVNSIPSPLRRSYSECRSDAIGLTPPTKIERARTPISPKSSSGNRRAALRPTVRSSSKKSNRSSACATVELVAKSCRARCGAR